MTGRKTARDPKRDPAPGPGLAAFLARTAAAVDRKLDRSLPPAELAPRRLHAAMRYAVFPGGKRLRPALVALGYRAAGGRGTGALPAAAAVELVHSFSLVHDDMPCMDDSPLRRGRASVHAAFDEATALLAGDALLALAFALLGRPPAAWPPGAALAILDELTAATGARGMVGGQAAERDLLDAPPDPPTLERVHRMKTGRLFEAAAVSGGLAAGASPALLTGLRRYARHFGLAFQIADDLLDLTLDGEGAPDTYPGVLGRAGAAAALEGALAAAIRAARALGPETGPLAVELARIAGARTS